MNDLYGIYYLPPNDTLCILEPTGLSVWVKGYGWMFEEMNDAIKNSIRSALFTDRAQKIMELA